MNTIDATKKVLKYYSEEKEDKAIKCLYENYHDTLLRFIIWRMDGNKYDAEDILQNSYIAVINQLRMNKFKQKLGSIKSYMYAICENRIVTYYARGKQKKYLLRTENATDYLALSSYKDYTTNNCTIPTKENLNNLRKHINKLPQNLRVIILLRKSFDCNYKEIQSIMSYSKSEVDFYIHQAYTELRKLARV